MTGTAIRGEVARKTIHLAASLAAATFVWRLEPTSAATVLAAAAGVALLVELLRQGSPRFGQIFRDRFGPMLRRREARRLTGATTLAIGFTAAALLVPGPAAVAGILYIGVGDAVAALVGRRWGRHRYPGGKSLEGSGAFMAATLVITLLLGIHPGPALAIAAATTVIEAVSLPLDDNLYLPAAGAAVFRAITGI